MNFKSLELNLGVQKIKKYFSSTKPIYVGDPFLSAQDRKLLERQKGREIDKKNRIDTIVANAKRAGKEIDPSSVDLPDLKPWNPCGPQVETNDLCLTEFDKTTKDSVVLERLRKDKEKRGQKKLKKKWKPVLKILSAIHCQKVVQEFSVRIPFRSTWSTHIKRMNTKLLKGDES